jgi:methylglutaconyl-CoA hydratase
MSDALALYELRPPAAVITLNRPEKRNALNRGLIAALTDAVRRAANDDGARCVILTGAGSVFCAGMDLAELGETVNQTAAPASVWDDALRLATLYDLIYGLPKPTVAAVNGSAVAGGAGLITVCDLAVASDAARFGYPEVRRGLVAAMVTPHLLRHVGERTARYLLLTGELIDAAEAVRSGLINASVPAADVMTTAAAWARSLAEGGPRALTATKDLLKRLAGPTMSVEDASRASAAPRLSDECREGLRAFFAHQPAPWAAH